MRLQNQISDDYQVYFDVIIIFTCCYTLLNLETTFSGGGLPVSLCDYLFPGDNTTDACQSAKELLGLTVRSEHVDDTLETLAGMCYLEVLSFNSLSSSVYSFLLLFTSLSFSLDCFSLYVFAFTLSPFFLLSTLFQPPLPSPYPFSSLMHFLYFFFFQEMV